MDMIMREMKKIMPLSDAEIKAFILRNDLIVEPYGFAILYLSREHGIPPTVLHFHSEGTRVQTRQLVQRTLDFVREKGYTKLRANNRSGASDAVWKRTFRQEGWSLKPVTEFEFEVKK